MHLFILFSFIGFFLFLDLANFLVAPLGAAFLRQRVANLRVDPSGPKGASSSDVPPLPSSTGVDAAETSGAIVAADVPPPTTLDDSDIRHTLDHVLTIQAA